MTKIEVRQIFFELLTEDKEFQQKLTEFILAAVAEKFVERVAQEVEPPKTEESEPAVEQGGYTKDFVEKVVEYSDFDKLSEDKKSVESQRDELQAKFDKLNDDKKSVESQRDDLQAKFDKLSDDKKSVERQRDELQANFDKLSNDKKVVESQRDDLQAKFDKLSDDKKSVESQRDELQAKFDKLSNDKKVVESQRDELQAKFDKLSDDKKSVESQRDELQAKFDKLSNDKKSVERQRDELQAKFDKLNDDKKVVESQRDEFSRKFENVCREKELVESQRDEFDRQLESLLKDKETLEIERDELKKQLAERFAEGWDVYQTFLNLDATTRENSGLYAINFESFICSGAQQRLLGEIWEAALDCKRNGKKDDAEIFWAVFSYCVYLVNAAQKDNIIEILNTQEGERYDTDKHSTSGTNSSTQGVVREIILAGYKNNINRKIVKKSNVRVG